MYEAILSEDGHYNIPNTFKSRTVEVLQVYLKSLGVRMESIFSDDEYIGEAEHGDDTVEYVVGNTTILCSTDEMYYLKKLGKTYHRYLKENPGNIDDVDEVWEYILDNLPFKKKYLTDRIIDLFRNNLEDFAIDMKVR